MITIITARQSRHQRVHAEALYSGLCKHGIKSKVTLYGGGIKTKYVACWGWRIGKILREKGHEVLVMERGYIGDRFAYTSLGWNGLNGYAQFPEYPADGARFKQHGIEIKPWKKEGEYALILGQVPHDASLQGKDLVPWYTVLAKQIKEIHNIPVHFRPHPDLAKKNLRQFIDGTIHSEGTLEEALSGALFTSCFNSNSSVDSILSGVPCVIGDKGSMAYDMCGKLVDEIIYPDREKWAHRLAWTQWTINEIETGYALEGICKRMQS